MAGTSVTSEAVCRRPIIAVRIIVILLLINTCGVLATRHTSSARHMEHRHAWKEYGPSGRFAFSAVARSNYSKNTTNLLRSLTRRVVTSEEGVSKSRGEVDALTAFKAAITDDPLGVLRSWHSNDSDPCGWKGVVCSSQHPKHVVALNLGSGQLVGSITSALQKLRNLPFLQRLDLSANVFTGSIPGPSLANLSNLSYLNVSSNQLGGEIPSQVEELVNLQTLDFGSNNLTGEIPLSVGNCTSLIILKLGMNFIEGLIPPVLGRLSALKVLDLIGNRFSGSIPLALGNCTSLTFLEIGTFVLPDGQLYPTNLADERLPDFSRLENLTHLALSGCNFQGAFPTWVVNLTALYLLSLSYNGFHGEIPENIGQLQGLTKLYLGGNNLTGAIPVSITNCTALTAFTLETNYVTGHIPAQIGMLRNLQIFSVAVNNFTGVIPSSLKNCSGLTILQLGLNPLLNPQIIPLWLGSLRNLSYLHLEDMNLQGEIPEDIGKLSNLRELYLDGNYLTGGIPASLRNCTSLDSLDLSVNKLAGEIPSEIGLLSELRWLRLVFNSLTGSFPAFIANLTGLEMFAADYNLLTGKIDGDLGKLSQLQTFAASENEFSGLFPETLSNCSNLSWISLGGNKLTGEIPPSLGNMTGLVRLNLQGNQFQGMIPGDLFRNSNLEYLELQLNQLEGNVPSSIGESQSLAELYLNSNNLTGIVPSSLRNCSYMLILDLSFNKFTGSIPGYAISQMSQLTSVNLSHNLLSGFWPQQLSRLTNIQEIDVSVNNISGSILPGLGSCTSLVRLDVSINNLTGTIPQDLGLLEHLDFFNASYNNFQGPVPDFKTNLTTDSFMGNPGLCGSILGLHQECAAPPTPHNVTSVTCRGFKCKQTWIATSCVLLIIVLVVVAGVRYWVTTRHKARSMCNTYLEEMKFAPHFRFSEKDVVRTVDGDGENVIGRGSKSLVYKGVTLGGELVAVKILPSYQGNEDIDNCHRESDLLKEVHTLSKVRHRNILKVLSFCSTSDVKAIILEYMPEGSLHKHLHEQNKCELTWQTRLKIAVGVAEAMKYLHHDFPEPIIHRDLKPSNILLDANLDPKVGDFGLSKFVNVNRDGEATASTVCGTIGYMPPEYALGTSVSTKGDVYSYGMVLLELLTARQPTGCGDICGQSVGLREWVLKSFQERPFQILDPTLMHEGKMNTNTEQQMMLLMRVALICTGERPHSRPSMSDALAMLKQIKEIGSVPTTFKTLEDLVNEITVWSTQEATVENAASDSDS